MKKRIVSLLTVIIVLVLAFSVPTFAAKYVASVDGKSFTSVQKAVNSMKSGQTLTLLSDVSSNSTVKINLGSKKVSFNFAGNRYQYSGNGTAFTISSGDITFRGMKVLSKNYAFTIKKGSTVTLSNGRCTGYIENKGSLTINGGSYGAVGCVYSYDNKDKDELIQNYNKLTINKGDFTGYKDNVVCIFKGSTVINGGKFVANVEHEDMRWPVISVWKNTSLIVNNGSFSGKGSCIDSGGKTTIKGGKFKSTNYITIYNYQGNMRIEGGTVTGTKDYYAIVNEKGNMTIVDVTVKGGVGNETTKNRKLKIYSGSFSDYSGYYNIRNFQGTMEIAGGKFVSKKANTVYNDKGAKLVISDGVFLQKGDNHYALYNLGKATLTGGSFTTRGYKYAIGSASGSVLKKNSSVDGEVDYQ